MQFWVQRVQFKGFPGLYRSAAWTVEDTQRNKARKAIIMVDLAENIVFLRKDREIEKVERQGRSACLCLWRGSVN